MRTIEEISDIVNKCCIKKAEEMRKKGLKPDTFAWVLENIEEIKKQEERIGFRVKIRFSEGFMNNLRLGLVLLYLSFKSSIKRLGL